MLAVRPYRTAAAACMLAAGASLAGAGKVGKTVVDLVDRQMETVDSCRK